MKQRLDIIMISDYNLPTHLRHCSVHIIRFGIDFQILFLSFLDEKIRC